MGLLSDWLRSKKLKDPVRGTLYVTASTTPPDSATSANFAINGIVSAAGIAPTAIEHQGVARTRKWPQAGQTLPASVDRADPTRIRIEWDEVPDSWNVARQQAEHVAEAMPSPDTLRPDPSGRPGTISFSTGSVVFEQAVPTTIDASNVPGLREEIMKIVTGHAHDPAAVQRLVHAKLVESGVLNPDGTAGPAATVPGPGARPGSPPAAPTGSAGGREDPATRLRKLQELHRDGLVSEEEYARLRLQILTEL